MEDILLKETCPHCRRNLTLMSSIRVADGSEWAVKRCLECGRYPVTEVFKVKDGEPKTEGLKPCPFCGEAVEMREPYPKWEEYGIVYDCMIIHTCKGGFGVSIYTKHGYKTPEEAREAMAKVWNQRNELNT